MFFSYDFEDDDGEAYYRKIVEAGRRAFAPTETEEDLNFFRYHFETSELEVDEHDYKGIRTQLHNAAFNNALRIAEYLLMKNANAFLVAENGYNALLVAAKRKHDKMLGLILNKSSRERVKKYIDAKTTRLGFTALHFAAMNNRYEAVRLLLSFGANFEAKDNHGIMAIQFFTTERVSRLFDSTAELSRAAIEAKNWSLKDLELRLNNLSPYEYLATNMARNRQGYTPLQVALHSNHLPTFRVIGQIRLTRISPECALSGSLTSLDEKVKLYWNNLMDIHLRKLKTDNLSKEDALKEGSYALLCSWKTVEAFEEYRKTLKDPYFIAPYINFIEEVLEVFQFDPQHFDANYEDDSTKFVTRAQDTRYYKMLSNDDETERSSFVEFVQYALCIPIAMLVKFISSSKLLAAVKEGDLEAAKECANSTILGVDVDIQDADERRPLHIAVEMGNYEMVKFLLANKADMLKATEEDNETPLHVAVKKGHYNIVELLLNNCDEDKINDYVNAKIKSTGMTALHVAGRSDRLDMAWILIAHHAVYCIPDKSGKEPIDLSSSGRMKQFFKFIDGIFSDARYGRARIIERLKNLERHFLLAVGNVRDIEGHNLPQVATLNENRTIGTQIFNMIVEAKKNFDAQFSKM